MKLSDLSVRRPVFAAVVAMLVAVAGIIGFFALSVREYPDVDPPVVSVETRYIGAAANVVETRITQVLEEQLAGVEGLQTITSRSQDGQSNISIEFTAGRDIDSAANDVRDRVSAAANNLPTEVEPPVVRKVDADSSPIMFLVISKPGWDRLQLSDWVDRNLLDRFSAIDGVARVFIGGEITTAWSLIEPIVRGALRERTLTEFGGTTEILVVPAEDHPRLRGAVALVAAPAFAAPMVA
jgi:multidrug efflux pump